MSGKIITISRQYGSAGRGIGKLVAEKLGLECYDSQIIAQIAEKSGFDQDYVRENSEDTAETGFFAALSGTDFYGHSNRDEIWMIQCRIIRELAEKGPCVIVGRSADYILKEDYDLVRVFVYADMEDRIKRVVEEYDEGGDNPQKNLKAHDKRRAAYYEIYTDQKFGDYHYYDMCLNSSSLGIEKCADIIAELYQIHK